MVVKLRGLAPLDDTKFESSVIPSGSKTQWTIKRGGWGFESSVIPSGSKTYRLSRSDRSSFESSVIPSGSKTDAMEDLPC